MELVLWGGFLGIVFILLALDLGVFNRKEHIMSVREALGWTALWVVTALVFNIGIYFIYEYDFAGISEHYHDGARISGMTAAIEFLTGYLVEKSLSLDNIFVISMIFSFFAIPRIHQHRVLFWGILGALVLRGLMIFLGAELVSKFEWMVYIFAAILLITALKMLFSRHEEINPAKNPVVKLVQKLFHVTTDAEGPHFVTRINGILTITPLLLALLVIETADVIFAVDSIPAIFGITHDPFIVFTSNIFALLGLRSLYFALDAMVNRFRFLKQSLIVILLYVSAKMICSGVFHDYIVANNLKDMLTFISLGVILVVMTLGVAISMLFPPKRYPVAASSTFTKELMK